MLPPRAGALARRYEALRGGRAWPSPDLAEAALDLAAHGRAVYGFGLWWIGADGPDSSPAAPSASSESGLDWASEVDWSAPWPEVVAACREWALLAAEFAGSRARPGSVLVARVDWLDASDLGSGADR
ncbi:hypothetical protein SAVIM338S_01627 [Streptomyces avidinii]